MNPSPDSDLPLKGVRVLDLTRLLPGPYATLMLADMGAEVVKIEEPGQGDYARWMPPQVGEVGAPFVGLNRGKKSVVLDLKSEPGRQALRRLMGGFDVVVEGFRPGVMERLGVGYDEAAARHPRLIWCAITGYGHTGPMRDAAGHDLNYISLAGLLGIQGPVGGPPEIPAFQVADIAGGALQAVSAILAALLQRGVTGRGRFLDVSMTEGALALMAFHLAGPLVGAPSEPPGLRFLSGGLVNYGIYRTSDGQAMALGSLEPRFWSGFCRAVGREDLLPAIQATGEERELYRWKLAELFMGRSRAEWEELASAHDVCLTPVLTPEEVIAHPLHRERAMVGSVQQPGMGEIEVLRTPTPFGRGSPMGPAPALGEHTREVLRSEGFSDDEIAQLGG